MKRQGPRLTLSLDAETPPVEPVTVVDVEAPESGYRLRITRSVNGYGATLETAGGQVLYSNHWEPRPETAIKKAVDFLGDRDRAASAALRESALAELRS